MKKIFVVGNISLDLILGEINAIPRWGVELLIPGYTMRPGGQASNVSLALGSLRVPVYVVGTIGDDSFGSHIRSEYENWSIHTDFLFSLPSVPTGLSVAVTNRETHERTFLTDLGAQSELSMSHFEQIYPFIQSGDLLIICGYFLSEKIRSPELVSLVQKIKSEKPDTVLFLDTGWPPEGWTESTKREIQFLLPEIDYFIPNEIEIEGFIGTDFKKIHADWDGVLIVKTGKKGCDVYTPFQSYHVSSVIVEVKDTIGAGDYFDAGFMWGLLNGFPLLRAVQAANIVASLNISLDAGRKILARDEDVQKALRGENISINTGAGEGCTGV
ncbi:MAG: carbohydrate kinase family protein [Candidatus Atribacteria bacterium]|nr:carbohydrate kinase family protein [Candidatus Atribacteria bacterium]